MTGDERAKPTRFSPAAPRPIRIVIADDEPPARAKVRRFLARCPDVCVVGGAGSGPEAVELVERSPGPPLPRRADAGPDGFGVSPPSATGASSSSTAYGKLRRPRRGARRRLPPQAVRRGALPDHRARETDPEGGGEDDEARLTAGSIPPDLGRPTSMSSSAAATPRSCSAWTRSTGSRPRTTASDHAGGGPPRARHAHGVRARLDLPASRASTAHTSSTWTASDVAPVVPATGSSSRRNRAHAQPPLRDRLPIDSPERCGGRRSAGPPRRGLSRCRRRAAASDHRPRALTPHPPPVRLPPQVRRLRPARSTPALPSTAPRRSHGSARRRDGLDTSPRTRAAAVCRIGSGPASGSIRQQASR